MVILYLIGVAVFLRRASLDPPRWLPAWGMNVLGLAYLPLFFLDLFVLSHGLVRAGAPSLPLRAAGQALRHRPRARQVAGVDRRLLPLPRRHGHQRPPDDRALSDRVPGAGAGAADALRLPPRPRPASAARTRRSPASPCAASCCCRPSPSAVDRGAALPAPAARARAVHRRPRRRHRRHPGGRRLLRPGDPRLDRPHPRQPRGGDAGARRGGRPAPTARCASRPPPTTSIRAGAGAARRAWGTWRAARACASAWAPRSRSAGRRIWLQPLHSQSMPLPVETAVIEPRSSALLIDAGGALSFPFRPARGRRIPGGSRPLARARRRVPRRPRRPRARPHRR